MFSVKNKNIQKNNNNNHMESFLTVCVFAKIEKFKCDYILLLLWGYNLKSLARGVHRVLSLFNSWLLFYILFVCLWRPRTCAFFIFYFIRVSDNIYISILIHFWLILFSIRRTNRVPPIYTYILYRVWWRKVKLCVFFFFA